MKDGITHLIFFDESNELYERAMPLAADGELYSWTLYEVLSEGAGGVSLTNTIIDLLTGALAKHAPGLTQDAGNEGDRPRCRHPFMLFFSPNG